MSNDEPERAMALIKAARRAARRASEDGAELQLQCCEAATRVREIVGPEAPQKQRLAQSVCYACGAAMATVRTRRGRVTKARQGLDDAETFVAGSRREACCLDFHARARCQWRARHRRQLF